MDAPTLAACANPVTGSGIRFRKLAIDLADFALLVTAPPGDRRLFVVGRHGSIRILDEAEHLLPEPFLDLGDAIPGPVTSTGNEQGLLGLAFHPEYAANGTFYVYYTQLQVPAETLNPYRDVLARCQRSATDPNQAAPTCTEVLSIPDFAANHNGGMIEFGRDGYLYVGTGDGGGANDPKNNGQALVDDPTKNTHALLGKMLRLDVDHPAAGKAYGIPADNPFGNEIFQLGLRNPWRWSFDSANGDMWIGDVGQNAVEELIHVTAAEARGANFGWDMWEGHSCHSAPCTMTGMTFAVDERTHAGDGWNAVIGGSVYRGTCYPDLVGTYLYANFEGRILVRATLQADGTLAKTQLVPAPGAPPLPAGTSSIHADARGELYLTTTSGLVYQVEGGPP